MTRLTSVLTALAVIVILSLSTTNANAAPHTKVHRLTDKIYRVECIDFGTANVTIYEGQSGLLVVDAGYYTTRDSLAAVVAGIGNGQVKTLILTHAHGDHVGGSGPIGKGATIIAHENAAKRLEVDYGFMGDDSPVLMPTVTMTDTMTIDFEGETVKLTHYPRSHTDGDLIVHFMDSKVLCLGDLAFSEKLPFVHTSRGGTFTGLLKSLPVIMETYGDDVVYVPGHGKTMTSRELKAWNDETVRMVEVVGKNVDDGKTVEQMVEADVLKQWDHLHDPVYTTKDLLIQLVYQDKVYAGNPPKPISDVIRPVILEQGAQAGVKLYRELRQNDPNHYDFNIGELNSLGYNLMARDLLDEAVIVFQLNIEQFPNNFNVYDSMGEAFMNRGDTELAIKNYQKSLDLNPANENAVVMLKKLKGEG